jgi:hypothetical protein
LTWLKQGRKDYFLGGHPLWQVCRSVYQMSKRPYLLGGSLLLVGYLQAFVTRVERPISRDLIRFHRQEQLARLKGFLAGWFKAASGRKALRTGHIWVLYPFSMSVLEKIDPGSCSFF